jgi:hypothetical protein
VAGVSRPCERAAGGRAGDLGRVGSLGGMRGRVMRGDGHYVMGFYGDGMHSREGREGRREDIRPRGRRGREVSGRWRCMAMGGWLGGGGCHMVGRMEETWSRS